MHTIHPIGSGFVVRDASGQARINPDGLVLMNREQAERLRAELEAERTGLPVVNVDDGRQNGFVQDWLAAWTKRHLGEGDRDHDAFEAVIEAIQETFTYAPAEVH